MVGMIMQIELVTQLNKQAGQIDRPARPVGIGNGNKAGPQTRGLVSVAGPQNVLAVAERVIMIAGWRCLEVEAHQPYAAKKLHRGAVAGVSFVSKLVRAIQAREQCALKGGRLRSLISYGFGKSGRCAQGVAEQIRPGVFNVMRKTSDHKGDSVVAAAKDTLRLDAEPLRPCDANEIRREARARNLPVAFYRNAGGALACGSCALNDKIVCKPAPVASLPLQAIDFAEIHAERVGPRQEIKKKARADAVLIAEAGSGSELNGRFFLRGGLLHRQIRGDSLLERSKNICNGLRDEQAPKLSVERYEGRAISIRYAL